MLRSWAHLIAAWFERTGTHAARRRVRSRRRRPLAARTVPHSAPRGTRIAELLTSIVGVHVSGNSIALTEVRGGSTSTEIDFSVAYTSSQVVLTGTNGTEFRQNGQTQATDTINITGPASLKVQLNQHVNDVSISGDGSSNLAALNLNLGRGEQTNSITLDSVIADKVNVTGQRSE